VAEFHQVARVGDGPLEPAEGALDGLTITDVDLDVNIEGGGRAGAGVCLIHSLFVVVGCGREMNERRKRTASGQWYKMK
jgi:hypothetical protein